MADRDLANARPDLAAKVQVIAGLDVRLALIDTKAGEDKYHVMQGLRVTDAADDDPKCCYLYQRSGGTGTRGAIDVTGPHEMPKVAKAFAKVFLELTGHEWGSVEPGHRPQRGKYWLQQQPTPDLEAKWQYYVSDGVDGKRTGWYSYEVSASMEVEEIYAQHVANAREQRTATRLVHSGYFTYKIDLTRMIQTNSRTRKERVIRRAAGEAEAAEGAGGGRRPMKVKEPRRKPLAPRAAGRPTKAVMRRPGAAALKAAKVMKKAMKKVIKKAMKKSKFGSRKAVFAGKKEKTKTGKQKDDLMKNKAGKLVTKKASAAGRKRFQYIAKWVAACKKAKEDLGLTGFVKVKKGTALYEKAKGLLPTVEPHKLG